VALPLRQLVLTCLAVALTAGIAGCGSSDPLAADSVTTIITEAKANTIAAQSFTVSGGPSASLSVDLTIVRGLGCTGTIVQGTTAWKLIWTGQTVYAHTARMPTNEWMRAASSTADIQGLIDLCKPGSLLAPLSASGLSSAVRTVTTYDGQSAVALNWTDPRNGQPGSIVVTDTHTPVLLNISQPGSGNLTFTGYGSTQTIAPPSAG
jgi:hypothetical protein